MRTIKNPIKYSETFRNAVKKAYPNNQRINKLLGINSYDIGMLLDTSGYQCSTPSIPVETIIEYLEHEDYTPLLQMAKEKLHDAELIKLKRDVYHMWDGEVYSD